MAQGMCCVVLSMYEPSADSSSTGSLSHMADHMTSRGGLAACGPDAGGLIKPTAHLDSQNISVCRDSYPDPPQEQHSFSW